MNDRIRELYQQAHSIRHHDGDPMRDGNPPTVYWQGEKSAEKFAELIVQECGTVINSENYREHSKGWNDAIEWADGMIKEHFGVKE